ncbi:phosphotransferase enzyme family protein [Paenibacillus alkalitolerans]|uniref:phosphotransferase enzyme family protein n=1 Tax=Paenibacillus alkalitolerans TaxID=2799335 RepID=UPI0018F5ED79|nr:phosphotransferase [Paenibacillus alkalitolerans]
MKSRLETEKPLPVLASVLSPNALAAEISHAYSIGVISECTLIRAYVNDIYAVKTQSGKYIVKVYRANWRTESELRYELDFLLHLNQCGVGVSLPIPRKDGNLLHQIFAPEGLRYIVLYHFAEGEKPSPPFSDDLYFRLGRELAKLHKASTHFHTQHKRLDNLHIADQDRITFYDFDAGGPGWCAYDLLGVYMYTKFDNGQSRWDSHIRGYQEVMKLNDNDIEALPYFHVMNSIWSLGCDATIWANTSGLWRISGERLDNQIINLRKWVDSEIKSYE